MKTLQFHIVLYLFVILLFTSCDPNALDSNSNYWNSSTLIRKQLNGKVKTITIVNMGTQITTFNQEGYITTEVYSSSNETINTTNSYLNTGEIAKTNYTFTSSNSTINDSIDYEYENNGKFGIGYFSWNKPLTLQHSLFPSYLIPSPSNFINNGLVSNLKSVTFNNGDIRIIVKYTFVENKSIVQSIFSSESHIEKDSAYLTYNGKYPVTITHGPSVVKNITYASNGMFKTFTVEERLRLQTKYYFKSDNKFLLIDSIVTNDGTSHNYEKYSYDSNKNISRIDYSNGGYGGYIDYAYVYDSHGNWTTKTISKGTSYVTEGRKITYW